MTVFLTWLLGFFSYDFHVSCGVCWEQSAHQPINLSVMTLEWLNGTEERVTELLSYCETFQQGA